MKTNQILLLALAVVAVAAIVGDGHSHRARSQAGGSLWKTQFGTTGDDAIGCVATDSQGNLIVAGGTSGTLFATNAGGDDIFIVKYGPGGNRLWTKQFGTPKDEDPSTVTVDRSDNVYAVGSTEGDLFSSKGGMSHNAFIVKYDASGDQLWAKQFGTSDCGADGAAVDGQNNVYVVGDTSGSLFGPNLDTADPTSYDVFLAKYDSNGTLLWAKQFGGPGNDLPGQVAVDGQGNAYVAGGTDQLFGPATGDDQAFLAKFGPDGSLLWGKKFGGPYKSFATSVCLDGSGSAYVAGYNSTDPSASEFSRNGFVAKYDTNGNQVWSKQIITTGGVIPRTICSDRQGNLVLVGSTKGNLFAPNAGDKDIFVAKYSVNGQALWSTQYGTVGQDEANNVTADNQGYVYVVGGTTGDLFASNSGGEDAFIQKISPSGQVVSARPHESSPYKPLLFAWSGQNISLNYPPLLVNRQPYAYVGYLCSGIPGARVQRLAAGWIAIEGHGKQVVIDPHSLIYQFNGKTHKMSAKSVLVNGRWYVPLDVMKAVLPYPVSYEAQAQRIRFDPPQVKRASR